MHKTITYYPHSKQFTLVFADGEMEEVTKSFLLHTIQHNITVCQELFVDFVRVWISRDLIDHKKITFHFDGIDLYPDKYGFIDEQPQGFCDYHQYTLTEKLNNYQKD